MIEEEKSSWIEVNNSNVNYDRLPMLEIIFDRFARLSTTSVRNMISENVDINITKISPMRFGDYTNTLSLPLMISVVKIDEWDNYALISFDHELVCTMVDVLLGGRSDCDSDFMGNRAYTPIERSLMEKFINVILNDIQTAFEPLTPATFKHERLETNPRFAPVTRPSNAVITIQATVDIDGRGGKIEFVIPYATLEPAREILLQMFMGEKFGRDSIWERHITSTLDETNVTLEAVLPEFNVPLGTIISLEKDSFIPLEMTAQSDVILLCGKVEMFSGTMGKKGDRIAIKIKENLRR